MATNNDYESFKKLLKFFTNQLDINNGLIKGKTNGKKGHKGKGRTLYNEWRHFSNFDLDCNFETGFNSCASGANYIQVSNTIFDIRPTFDKNKKAIGLFIDPNVNKKPFPGCISCKISALDLNGPSINKTLMNFFDEFEKSFLNSLSENKKDDLNNHSYNKRPIVNELNTILVGPPGTGKTYSLKLHTLAICKNIPFEEIKNKNYKEIKTEYSELVSEGRVQFITFHQSYCYEDFIEGFRPVSDGSGNIKYEVIDGIFKKFVKEAKEHEDKSYVFIIDEINRGNISKIFGELITLIEDSKRDGNVDSIKLSLPYSKEEFSITSNLYILGTMNTADRSISLIDTALRRRFNFVEMMPNSELLKDIIIDDINIKKMLDTINRRICVLYDREHQIGHSFFINLTSSSTINDLSHIFKNKIVPLLQEYFYDDYSKIRAILADELKEVSLQFIKKITFPKDKALEKMDIDNDDIYVINNEAFEKSNSYKKIYLE